MTSDTVHVVTGGSKGIGFALVNELITRPNTVVIATARDPSKATQIQKLAKTHPNLHVLAYDASVRGDAKQFATAVSKIVGGVDVLHANAGIFEGVAPALETLASSFERHFSVNFVGPVELFQEFYPLVKKRKTRKVVFTSTVAGQSGTYRPLEASPYGASKAALNFITKSLSVELADDNFIIVALHPGVVSSDDAVDFFDLVGKRNPAAYEWLKSNTITPEESAKTQLKTIDKLTAESTGKFIDTDGTPLDY